MPNVIKVLGQSKPSATTLTAAYTVPALTSTVVSSLVVCNQSATATTFRIAIQPAGAAIEPKHYIYYDVILAGNDTFIATIGLTLGATDVVSVYNDLATLSLTSLAF